ncbi:hypothetical protein OG440_39480 (plasmid) [Streptomyces sp. NBC_00637]|uniref:hypothetical protein n=1 Tax=Streptomyces sp. NBC_00637 TaxID=2903667 RepID=UPI002F90D5F8
MSEYILVVLILLACPVGMGLMMWWMQRYARQNQPRQRTATPTALGATEVEVVRLRAEIDQLKAAHREASESGGRQPQDP